MTGKMAVIIDSMRWKKEERLLGVQNDRAQLHSVMTKLIEIIEEDSNAEIFIVNKLQELISKASELLKSQSSYDKERDMYRSILSAFK